MTLNLLVGIDPSNWNKVISERIWYSQAINEIENKDQICLLFFYTFLDGNAERKERFIIGCFVYPKYVGNATRDSIAKKFIPSQDGQYSTLVADEDFAVSFSVYVKLPYLPSKKGEKVWQIDDADALSILKISYDAHAKASDDIDTNRVKNVLELLIEEMETKTSLSFYDAHQLASEVKQIPNWLRNELEQCQLGELPQTYNVVKNLLSRAFAHPLYNLQAAKIQIKLGDYKFLLSLANYCYSMGFLAFKENRFDDSSRYFLEAANLYQKDPMITGSEWKQQKRLECISKFIEAHVCLTLLKHSYQLSYSDLETQLSCFLIGQLRKYLPAPEIQKRLLIVYYTAVGWHLYNSDPSAFCELLSALSEDIRDLLPKELLAIYFDQVADKYSKRKSSCYDDFLKAAQHKNQAVLIYKQLWTENPKNERAQVGYLERSIDYYKFLALAASCNNEVDAFAQNIDTAIYLAEQINDSFPSEPRQENVHFLKGLKYGELSKSAENAEKKAHFHLLAYQEYKQCITVESQRRYYFHQLMYFFHRLCHLIVNSEDWDAVRLLSQEALLADCFAASNMKYLPLYMLEEHKVIHLSISTFSSNADLKDLEYLRIVVQESESIKSSIRKIARLVYGIQLIRLCGITDERIIGKTVKAIRSAIRQLLESRTILADEIYDELEAEKEKSIEEQTEQEIFSRLRRRKIEEDLTLEVKEKLFEPNSEKFSKTISQCVIAFLNSPYGGSIVVGVEDDTYSIIGIESDLAKFQNSKDKLKQAILSHIQDRLPSTLHKYLPQDITITYPQVQGHTLILIKIPPGIYDLGLYVDVDGIAYIRKDGRLQRITDPVERDELSHQKRNKQGIWTIAYKSA
jgi:hypothetical protein